MNDNNKNWKECGIKQSLPNLRYCHRVPAEEEKPGRTSVRLVRAQAQTGTTDLAKRNNSAMTGCN
jgi:hypothetical protein